MSLSSVPGILIWSIEPLRESTEWYFCVHQFHEHLFGIVVSLDQLMEFVKRWPPIKFEIQYRWNYTVSIDSDFVLQWLWYEDASFWVRFSHKQRWNRGETSIVNCIWQQNGCTLFQVTLEKTTNILMRSDRALSMWTNKVNKFSILETQISQRTTSSVLSSNQALWSHKHQCSAEGKAVKRILVGCSQVPGYGWICVQTWTDLFCGLISVFSADTCKKKPQMSRVLNIIVVVVVGVMHIIEAQNTTERTHNTTEKTHNATDRWWRH